MLSAEELLAGGALSYKVDVPSHVLHPDGSKQAGGEAMCVKLRPLTVLDLQLVSRAAKDNDNLVSVLMVQAAVVEPKMTIANVNAMHVGLIQFLLAEVNRISGIVTTEEQIEAAMEDPLVKAAYLLASEFGWTPDQVSEMTLGQIMLSLQMLKDKRAVNG